MGHISAKNINVFKTEFFSYYMAKKICLFFGHYDPARQTIMDYYEKIFPKDVNLTVACASRFDRERYKIKAPVIEFLDRKFIVPFKLRRFCRKNKIDLVVNYTGQAEVSMTLFLATVFSRTKSIFYF